MFNKIKLFSVKTNLHCKGFSNKSSTSLIIKKNSIQRFFFLQTEGESGTGVHPLGFGAGIYNYAVETVVHLIWI